MYQNPIKLAKLPNSGMPTNGSIRLPILIATFSGMTAALASSARRASASRRSRSLRNSASRRSASRERSVRNSSEPAVSSLVDEDDAPSSPPLPSVEDWDEATMGVSMDDDDDGEDDFCFVAGVVVVGLSPNPFPAMTRSVRDDDDDDDVECRCRRTIEGGERCHGEEGAVKADAGIGERVTDMTQRLARGMTTMAAMAVVIRPVNTMITIVLGPLS